MRKWLSPGLALILIACLLAGCSGDAAAPEVRQVKVGETISSASKWINSSIEGAIDENTPVNLKDDFYTAVNKEWILAQTLTEEVTGINFGTLPEDILRERKLAIVKGEGASAHGENPADIPEAQLKHNEDLLLRFGALAADWDARSAQGVEPLRRYVEAIESIASMADMTDYLLDKDNTNFSFLFPVNITVGSTFTDHTVNTVIIDLPTSFTLNAVAEYTKISDAGKLFMHKSNASVRLLLQKLGYPERQIERIIKDSYGFEMRLAKAQERVSTASDTEGYLKETDNRLSLAQLKDIEGDFPLSAILAHYGYDRAASYSVTYPQYISSLGALYNARYLDEIKAYYMVHLLNASMPLLDRATFDEMKELDNIIAENAPKPKDDIPDPNAETDNTLSGEDKEAAILLDDFIGKYLSEPLDQIYVARYCTAEQKAELKALIDRIVACYKDMLYEEEWLSPQARDMAVEKLENLTVRVLYPDTFNDYTGLDLSGCANLMDAVAAVNAFALTQRVEKINTPVEHSDWDMKAFPTTIVNAFYKPTDNSINIFAGILADGFLFNVEETYEETLAKIGAIVGHEITHAFDTSGYLFDKDGYYKNWWTPEDEQTFQLRANRLANYYSGIIPYPGGTGYNGVNVQGEAIADMGGVKCMLGIAAQTPGFDYELFFRTFASLWRAKYTYNNEISNADDVHPLNFLRVNVTLQQFEKFHETFAIQPGDGMYLAPDARVAVW